ncbi:nitroreductase [Temperatibacter marinus]|uniref:Putative NAD(P)H nitroreductase n=1 Tax=Temperatibacter marinus TaxID=1456591 RepID=A0AA52H998_9PROT|nr:nitroreductase [Temperatibacter marinus]WND01418.1 nitroreductase [Temperatibacter marinus]
MSFNKANPETIELLLNRRSVKTKDMTGPGPSIDELEIILTAAARVPDHGKLAPWRYIALLEDDRKKLGDIIAHALEVEKDVSDSVREKMRDYGMQAPICIVAIHSLSDKRPIPAWEQELSTGASIMNLLVATHALGYVGQWLTGWAAFSPTVASGLGLNEQEKVAGFIFLGSQDRQPTERPRPLLDEIVSWKI